MIRSCAAPLAGAFLCLAASQALAQSYVIRPGNNNFVTDVNNGSYTSAGAWLAAGTPGTLPLPSGSTASGQARGVAWSCPTGGSGTAVFAYADGSQGEWFLSSTGELGHAYTSVITAVAGCKIQAIY